MPLVFRKQQINQKLQQGSLQKSENNELRVQLIVSNTPSCSFQTDSNYGSKLSMIHSYPVNRTNVWWLEKSIREMREFYLLLWPHSVCEHYALIELHDDDVLIQLINWNFFLMIGFHGMKKKQWGFAICLLTKEDGHLFTALLFDVRVEQRKNLEVWNCVELFIYQCTSAKACGTFQSVVFFLIDVIICNVNQ